MPVWQRFSSYKGDLYILKAFRPRSQLQSIPKNEGMHVVSATVLAPIIAEEEKKMVEPVVPFKVERPVAVPLPKREYPNSIPIHSATREAIRDPKKESLPADTAAKLYAKSEITNTELCKPGFFYFTKALFTIETNKIEVKRAYKDFTDLASILKKNYPSCIIPPIHKSSCDRLTDENIKKRKHFLQLFLDDLMRHPVLHSCMEVEVFLKNTDNAQLQSIYSDIMRAKAGLPNPKNIIDLLSLKPCDENDEAKLDNFSMKLPLLNEKFKSLKRLSITLAKQWTEISKTYERLGEVIKDIDLLYTTFGEAELGRQFEAIQKNFARSSGIFVKIGNEIKNKFARDFRYSRHEVESIRSTLTFIERLQQDCEKASQDLRDAKKTQYQTESITEAGEAVSKESRIIKF